MKYKKILIILVMISSIMICCNYSEIFTYAGKVYDASDDVALPGVTITAIGYNNSTVSDLSGCFELRISRYTYNFSPYHNDYITCEFSSTTHQTQFARIRNNEDNFKIYLDLTS